MAPLESGGEEYEYPYSLLQLHLVSITPLLYTSLAAIPAVSLFLLGANGFVIAAVFLISACAAAILLYKLSYKAYKEAADNFQAASPELRDGISKFAQHSLNLFYFDCKPTQYIFLDEGTFQIKKYKSAPDSLRLGPQTEVYFKSGTEWFCCWNKTVDTISFDCGLVVLPSDKEISKERLWFKLLEVEQDARACPQISQMEAEAR